MKKISKILIVLFVLGIAIYYTYYKYNNTESNKADYTYSIYVETKSAIGNGNNYYEINNKDKLRIASNFEHDKIDKYYLKNCFESYPDLTSGKILNRFINDKCKIIDNKNNEIKNEGILSDIISSTDRLYNQINDIDIIKDNNHYYVSINFSLNERNYYKFYYYDESTKKLMFIHTFDDEYVINIKEKEKFIFDKEEA